MTSHGDRTFPATAVLADFISDLSYATLPDAVRKRMPPLLIDFFRVSAAGTATPWLVKMQAAFRTLGRSTECSVLYSDEKCDPVRAAYLNGTISGSLEWDDTHVGAMLHPGVVVWPTVLALGERLQSPGRDLLAAAAAGYETMIRIGLSVQPTHFRRGFQSTATCGVFGAAAAAARLLELGPERTRDALGLAASYPGGLTQFFVSGSEVKRIHAGKASACGMEAALLAHAGISGPHDAIEGSQGFARAYADAFDSTVIERGLGTEFHMLRLQMKPHAASARVLAAIEAAEALVADGLPIERIADIEIGVPSVIVGRLTNSEPRDLQQTQMSAPFAVAMMLVFGQERPKPVIFGIEEFETALNRPDIRALSAKIRCVVDDEIERRTTQEYVPARVSITLDDGRRFDESVFQPIGCPDRPMEVEDLSTRFKANAGDRIGRETLDGWMDLVEHLHERGSARDLMSLRL